MASTTDPLINYAPLLDELAEEDDRAAVFLRPFRNPTYRDQVFDLACHAAFPLTLTTNLVYCLRQEFTPHVPWHAAPDVLLSVLCDAVGHDLYEMRGLTRLYLLNRLVQQHGKDRLDALSDYMTDYIAHRINLEQSERSRILGDRPQWTALACLKPSEAVEQIQQALQQVAQAENARERMRLAAIVKNYANLIDPLERLNYRPLLVQWAKQTDPDAEMGGLVLHSFEAEVITLYTEDHPPPPPGLIPQTIETVKVNRRGEMIERPTHQIYYYVEPLGDEPNSGLEMIAIPSGEFRMGSADDGPGAYNDQKPQHPVKVSPFFISKTPVTQSQWKFVADLEPVERDLTPEPSLFKGDDRPVVQVSWHDAVEFCARLSRHTGREYRLPSEAEWEYACRAGTTSPFHFGDTLTSDIANYSANITFADEPQGDYRGETTPVGSFPPNAFGLHDMHGNVWDWCLDHWHANYEGAPTDGSAWIEGGDSDHRVRRGGSWSFNPRYCRSAYRSTFNPANRDINGGFRVLCVAPRT